MFQKILDYILKKPKLIIGIVLVFIVLFGIGSILSSGGNGTSGNGGHDTVVYGINFHIPDGYEEGKRADFTNGEYVDLEKDGIAIIEISVSMDTYFKESKYIDSKFSKTINNKQGTVYMYKAPSNGMAYVYYDQGKQVTIRGATFSELEQIII